MDTAIIDGRIVMKERRVLMLNEEEVLEKAQKMTETVIESNELGEYLEIHPGFGGSSKQP